MKPIVVRRTVAAEPAAVFAIASDFAGAAGRLTGIRRVEMLTSGPPGLGTRFRETRVFGSREAVETMEVVAWDAPRSYMLRATSCGAEFDSEVRCLAEGAGTRTEIEMRVRPVRWWAHLMAPLFALTAGPVRKCLEKDLADIAAAAEAAA